MGNNSWIESKDSMERVDEKSLPFSVNFQLSLIKKYSDISKNSIECYTFKEEGKLVYVIRCSLIFDRAMKIRENRIRNSESILIFFEAGSLSKVPKICCDRLDFPRDLPHLNIVSSDDPVHPCISRTSLSELYFRSGIIALLEFFQNWLLDAVSKNLEKDGWEPAPASGNCILSCNIGELQDLISQKLNRENRVLKLHISQLHNLRPNGERGAFFLYYKVNGELSGVHNVNEQDSVGMLPVRHERVNGYLIANSSIPSTNIRDFIEGTDFKSLVKFANKFGYRESVSKIIDENFKDNTNFSEVVIILGILRPISLLSTTPGLSSQSGSRKIELMAFSLLKNLDKELVVQLQVKANMKPDIFSKMSGYEAAAKNVVVIGNGAVGSKVAEHIVREGVDSITLVDYDRIEPHNISRHTLTSDEESHNKAASVAKRLKKISPSSKITFRDVNVLDVEVGNLTDQVIGKESGVVIDATASDQVMGRLCRSDNKKRVAKIELASFGRLGFIYLEGKQRSPSVDFLKAILPTYISESVVLQEFFSNEKNESVVTGIGCASDSLKISDSRISLHSGNFMTTLSKFTRLEQEDGGIGIAELDEAGYFKKWVWHSVEDPLIIHDRDSGFDIFLRKKEVEKILKMQEDTRNEMGGYLYGKVDFYLNRIYIAEIQEVEPKETTPTKLELPPPGTTSREQFITTKSGNHMKLLGSFHTHPIGSNSPSTTDKAQFQKNSNIAEAGDNVWLMMILSPEDALKPNITAHIPNFNNR